MEPIDDQAPLAKATGVRRIHRAIDKAGVPSLLMIAAAAIVIAWCFWPSRLADLADSARIAVGGHSPPLRAFDPFSGEPLLGLVPRGWYVWVVVGPDDDEGGTRLLAEIDRAEAVWRTMADLDQWRRVIVTTDATTARNLRRRIIDPPLTPRAIGLRRPERPDVWSGAQRVRHLLIEPTGRILMIEPAETDHAGSLKKIADDLIRRIRAWEGDFDDLPRFS